MKITKIYNFEGSHVVRNCTSHRCSHSVHGHSYKVEVEFEGKYLDNAGMLIDFGLLKEYVKPFIDTFDHCHVICGYDSQEYRDFFKKHNDRWIEVPFNPSAEMLSIMIFSFINRMLDLTEFNNGEEAVNLCSVTVHETATGRAQCDRYDMYNYWSSEYWDEIQFSNGVLQDCPEVLRTFLTCKYTDAADTISFKFPEVEQQITIPHFNEHEMCD